MKKLTYEFVKRSFNNEEYTLLSTEYIDALKYLDFICPNGHKHKITWGSWQQGQRCGQCSGNNKYEYEYIKQKMEKEEYILLSTEYKNNNTYLDYICPNGHKHKITWGNWQYGYRCGFCSGRYNVTYEFVKQDFENKGYKLLSTKYINSKQNLDYICPLGHKHKITWNNWQHGYRCPECSYIDKSSKPEKEIFEYISNFYIGTIIPNNRTLIKNPKTGQYLELDIWLPDIKKAIEYNGTFWHKNKYQKWKDNYKSKWCKENNIKLLIINDDNWRKNKDFTIISEFINE